MPKALHIYLWKQFWEYYGRGFDFKHTFNEMPESLHVWFLNMFKFAGDATTKLVVDDILRPDGIFSQRSQLKSEKGSRFLSTLAEANPAAVLKLLEITIGKWTDQELLDFKQGRQNLVWALEKIAVWPTLTVRAIQLLSRFAVNENASFSNNSTGTLVGLFRIGPEAAATESSPEDRLPAMLKLLRSSGDAERRLGLKTMSAALDSRGMSFRTVGPEYQGLKERAKLWMPKTYGEWWNAKFIYFKALVDETRNWPPSLRTEVCQTLLEAVERQIKTPPCTELAFQVLSALVNDSAMPPEKLNRFFWHWQEYEHANKHPEISKRLRRLERRYTERDLASRFQRYVIDVDYIEWDENFRERHHKSKNRAKILVNALAIRIARHPEKLSEIQHLLAPKKSAPALWHFGEQLALNDEARRLLPILTRLTFETKHEVCLFSYLSVVRKTNSEFYLSTVRSFLAIEDTAWLGANMALRSDYDDSLFVRCLDALEKRWINPMLFAVLRFGRSIESVPPERMRRLFCQLNEYNTPESRLLLVELLDSIPFNASSPFNSDFVFGVVVRTIPGEESLDAMHGYHWKNVCMKLVQWDVTRTLPLLDALLVEMGKVFRLSYDSNVEPLANELVRANPTGAWNIVKAHFEEDTPPKWRGDILPWLRGGLSTFDEEEPYGMIVDLPLPAILEWIEEDPESRSVMMAQAVPGTLDDKRGGRLTRELLYRYGQFDGVQDYISISFRLGGWSGPESAHLKRKRDKLRRWLASGFEIEVAQWIEAEIEYLDRNIEREEINEERERFD